MSPEIPAGMFNRKFLKMILEVIFVRPYFFEPFYLISSHIYGIALNMKEWPEFNKNGDLPIGIHRATLAEVIDHFGKGSLQRETVAQRLKRIYSMASQTGKVARFIIFGSFITTKIAPQDVDIFLLMDDSFDVGEVKGETAFIFNHMTAHNYEGASIFWIRRLAALDGEEEAVTFWQIKRNGQKRGIVEVISNDLQ